MNERFPGLIPKILDHQFLRFVLTGGVNTLFGYAIFLLGLMARLPPELALLIATITGALFNYITTARWVFKHHTLSRFVPFIGVYIVVYLANAESLRLLLAIGIAPVLAQAVLMPAIAVLSFALFRLFVFKPVQPS